MNKALNLLVKQIRNFLQFLPEEPAEKLAKQIAKQIADCKPGLKSPIGLVDAGLQIRVKVHKLNIVHSFTLVQNLTTETVDKKWGQTRVCRRESQQVNRRYVQVDLSKVVNCFSIPSIKPPKTGLHRRRKDDRV